MLWAFWCNRGKLRFYVAKAQAGQKHLAACLAIVKTTNRIDIAA